jgi:hypothetical protein
MAATVGSGELRVIWTGRPADRGTAGVATAGVVNESPCIDARAVGDANDRANATGEASYGAPVGDSRAGDARIDISNSIDMSWSVTGGDPAADPVADTGVVTLPNDNRLPPAAACVKPW